MNNSEKYINIYVESFNVSPEEAKNLKYRDVEEWDSVGHVELIAKLEEVFAVSLETEDVLEFNSFDSGIMILKRHNVEI